VSRSNDLASFLRASNFFISPTTSSDSHIIKPSTPQQPFASLFINQRISFIHSLQYFINHAIYHAQDFGRRFLHVRSCADHRHATTATNIIEHHSPKLNTSAFVALQAVG
jgi:hypothetical protein